MLLCWDVRKSSDAGVSGPFRVFPFSGVHVLARNWFMILRRHSQNKLPKIIALKALQGYPSVMKLTRYNGSIVVFELVAA